MSKLTDQLNQAGVTSDIDLRADDAVLFREAAARVGQLEDEVKRLKESDSRNRRAAMNHRDRANSLRNALVSTIPTISASGSRSAFPPHNTRPTRRPSNCPTFRSKAASTRPAAPSRIHPCCSNATLMPVLTTTLCVLA